MNHAQRVDFAARQFVRTPNGFLARHPVYGCVSIPDASYCTFRAYTSQDPEPGTAKLPAFRSFRTAVASLVD